MRTPSRAFGPRDFGPPARLVALSIALATALLAVSSPGMRADEVRLVSGTRLRGLILKETRKYWVVLVPEGIRAVDKAQVEDVSRGDSGKTEGVKSEGVTVSEGAAADPERARRGGVELVLSGEIDGKKLDSSDVLSVTHFEAFFKRCRPPLELARESESAGPYRIVLETTAGPHGKLEFSGLELANKYRCTLNFRLERRTGKRVAVLEKLALVEDKTGALFTSDGEEEDSTAMSRVAYESALRRLTEKLSSLPFFVRSGEEGEPPPLNRPEGTSAR